MSAVTQAGAGAGVAPPARRGRWLTVLMAVAVLAWLAAAAGLRPLALPDEGRYVGAALEMAQSGDWATPVLDGLPFFHKPPLFYWVTAASLQLFGAHEWAGRAAPLLGAWLAAWSLFLLLRRWQPAHRAGWARAALLVLLTQPFFYFGAQYANTDMLVAGCICACIALAAHAVRSEAAGRPDRRALWAAYAMAGLGVLAKGLIGIVLPGAVIVGWLAWERRWRSLLRLVSVPGLIVLAAVAMPWFALMAQRHPGFLHEFFVVQHVERFSQGGFNNAMPVWFYPVAIALLALPWTLWALALLRRPVRQALAAADEGERSLRRLLVVWAGVIVVFFSLPQSKLVGYVLPALPPLAGLLALLMGAGRDGGRPAVGRPAEGPAAGRSHAGPATATCPNAELPFSGRLTLAAAAALCLAAALVLGLRPPGPSSREAAAVVREQGAAQDAVLFVDNYLYDFGFYSGRRPPLAVLGNWHPDVALARDDWRKELAEAARFAPERAAAVLLDEAGAQRLLCGHARTWVLSRRDDAARHLPLLAGLAAAEHGGVKVWRVMRPTGCPPRPAQGAGAEAVAPVSAIARPVAPPERQTP